MDNAVLEDIKRYAVAKLNESYGYCGVADGPAVAMINSDDRAGNDILIEISLRKSDL